MGICFIRLYNILIEVEENLDKKNYTINEDAVKIDYSNMHAWNMLVV